MIKILYCIGEMGYGGAEILTVDLCHHLAMKGNKVHVAVIGYCEPNIAEKIAGAGITLHKFNSNLLSPLNILKIIWLIKRNSFDIVHAHLFPCLYWVSIASFFFRNSLVRWFYTEHSTSNSRRNIFWIRWLEKLIYSRYTRIICINENVKLTLLQWVPNLKNISVIQNGIDIKKFKSAKSFDRTVLGFSNSDVILLMVGAFRIEKNQSMLIRALENLPENFKLVLAGDGPKLQTVIDLSDNLNMRGRVHFLGAISEVGRVMKTSDIYVLPSLFEGFGISAMEASAAGLPVVVSDVDGLREIFQCIGILVDPKSANSISKGVLEASRRIKCGTSTIASDDFLYKYDIEATIENYLYSYNQIDRFSQDDYTI